MTNVKSKAKPVVTWARKGKTDQQQGVEGPAYQNTIGILEHE